MSATMKTSESYFLRGEEGGRAIFLEGDIFPWEEWGTFFSVAFSQASFVHVLNAQYQSLW